MIPVVEQNCNLRNVNGFSPKVVQITAEQFNQSLVIRNVGRSAMGEEGKPEGINGKMSLDTVSALVVTKAFGGDTRVASVFDRLRVNNE